MPHPSWLCPECTCRATPQLRQQVCQYPLAATRRQRRGMVREEPNEGLERLGYDFRRSAIRDVMQA
jgi:hypothetical protein